MANQNELFKALQLFQNGMRDLATSRAINQANEVVQNIKAQELNENQQRQELTGVANQLAQKLFSLGTPATTVQGIASTIVPPNTSVTSGIAGLTDSDPAVRDRTLEALATLNGFEITKKKAEAQYKASQPRNIDDVNEDIRNSIKEFNRLPFAKDFASAKQGIRSVSTLLEVATDPKSASYAAEQLAKIGFVKSSGESGKLSDRDIESAAGNPSWARKAKRFLKAAISGTPVTEDLEEARRSVEIIAKALDYAGKREARAYAKQQGRLIRGVTVSEFTEHLFNGLVPVIDPQEQTTSGSDPLPGTDVRSMF